MWYEQIVGQLDKEKEYTRQQIYETLMKEKPELTINSFKWIISEMVDTGIIYRKQRGRYALQGNALSEKYIYKPALNEQLLQLSEQIEAKFPYVNFVCFESVQLNEFLNHLIGRNTFFFLVEKDAIDFVFRYLQEETDWDILLKPSEKEWDAYCTGNNVVLLNLISEAPEGPEKNHIMSIEQLLVDIAAEKTFKNLYSRNELQEIYDRANKLYLINYARLLRYARRRGKADEVKKIIEDNKDAYTS